MRGLFICLILIFVHLMLSSSYASVVPDDFESLLTTTSLRAAERSESSTPLPSAVAAVAHAEAGIFEALDKQDLKLLGTLSLLPDFSERLHGEQERYKRALLLDIDISHSNPSGQSLALMLAARGALEALSAGKKRKLLLRVVQNQCWNLFDYMLECSCEVNVVDIEDPHAASVSLLALLGESKRMFARLLQCGANPNYGNTEMTLLQAAAKHGADWAVAMLMSAKANPMKVTDATKDSPLHIALAKGDYPFVKALRGHAILAKDPRIERLLMDMNLTEEPELFVNSQLLHIAMDRDDFDAFEDLRDAGASVRSQPLYDGKNLAIRALYRNKFAFLRYFCKFYNLDLSAPFSRISVNTMMGAAIALEEGIVIAEDRTVPLHSWDIIARSRYQELVNLAAEYGYTQPIEHFRRHGFDVNFMNPDGLRPLHAALTNGKWNVVHYYCKHYRVTDLHDAERRGFDTFVGESFRAEWAEILRSVTGG